MKLTIKFRAFVEVIVTLAAIALLIVSPINGLNTTVIVASERNLSIDLDPSYVIVDENATAILKITEQGMTHAYNITNASIPKAGNAVVAVLSIGDRSVGSGIDKYVSNFEDMLSSLIEFAKGKKIGERSVKDSKGQNVTVLTFDMEASSPKYIELYGQKFDFALWGIDKLNIGYVTVPSSLGRNVTDRIIATLDI
jgi:hypothetical protein